MALQAIGRLPLIHKSCGGVCVCVNSVKGQEYPFVSRVSVIECVVILDDRLLPLREGDSHSGDFLGVCS